ncbi:nitrile hydratase subunit beta [Taklimakanibacter lacteus]|uniref:nitrile hydratase subunit beta n=1 Tax=Taklimakanibacter lacteus TaxID=2268456 RepID=UPI000E6675B5
MNGPQDLGGQMGFGPVAPEKDEPIFHAPWEKKALALTLAMGATRQWNIDISRHARESLSPAQYLGSSYYEIWIAGLIKLMLAAGLVTEDEVSSGRMKVAAKKVAGKLLARDVAAVLAKGGPSSRAATTPRFKPGDRVRAKNMHPVTHTRLPRYLRGHVGEIVTLHGTHVFPDSNAHGQGENPQALYTVRFAARDIWGDARHPKDTVSADLWEAYLEPA